MKTSEGHESALRILRDVPVAHLTMPTKTLLNGKRYTSAANTDIRKTFAIHARYNQMKANHAKA